MKIKSFVFIYEETNKWPFKMKPERENNHDLSTFFKDEYLYLKKFVKSRISETAERDADDIIQDVALKLFSRNTNSPINNVAGFVYSAVRHKIVDLMRTKKKTVPIQNETEEKLIDLMEWLYNTADNMHSEKMKHELKKAIANLKPEYRQVILAIDFERITYKELALETGTSQGTLMSRRHRALAILNKELGKKKNNN